MKEPQVLVTERAKLNLGSDSLRSKSSNQSVIDQVIEMLTAYVLKSDYNVDKAILNQQINDILSRLDNIPSMNIDDFLSLDSENPVQNKIITAALNAKPDKDTTYTAGTNVTIDANNVISAVDTKYAAGNNITIDNNVISATDTTYTASDFDIKDLADSTNLKSTWSNKQDQLTAGTNITIENNVISANVTESGNKLEQVENLDNFQAEEGKIVQYIGETNSKYTNGYVYKKTVVSSVIPGGTDYIRVSYGSDLKLGDVGIENGVYYKTDKKDEITSNIRDFFLQNCNTNSNGIVTVSYENTSTYPTYRVPTGVYAFNRVNNQLYFDKVLGTYYEVVQNVRIPYEVTLANGTKMRSTYIALVGHAFSGVGDGEPIPESKIIIFENILGQKIYCIKTNNGSPTYKYKLLVLNNMGDYYQVANPDSWNNHSEYFSNGTTTEERTIEGVKWQQWDVQPSSSNDFTDSYKNKLDGIESGANNYSLPIASVDTLGGIKVGNNLSIDANGVLSATGSSITIDSQLSSVSENAVQNKTLYDELRIEEGATLTVDGVTYPIVTLDASTFDLLHWSDNYDADHYAAIAPELDENKAYIITNYPHLDGSSYSFGFRSIGTYKLKFASESEIDFLIKETGVDPQSDDITIVSDVYYDNIDDKWLEVTTSSLFYPLAYDEDTGNYYIDRSTDYYGLDFDTYYDSEVPELQNAEVSGDPSVPPSIKSLKQKIAELERGYNLWTSIND